MRNPLSAILQCADEISSTLTTFRASGSDVIAESIVTDSIDAAQTIALCAQHQKRIVDDVLTLSKLDSAMLMVRIARPTDFTANARTGYTSRCAAITGCATGPQDVRRRSSDRRHTNGVCPHQLFQRARSRLGQDRPITCASSKATDTLPDTPLTA